MPKFNAISTKGQLGFLCIIFISGRKTKQDQTTIPFNTEVLILSLLQTHTAQSHLRCTTGVNSGYPRKTGSLQRG